MVREGAEWGASRFVQAATERPTAEGNAKLRSGSLEGMRIEKDSNQEGALKGRGSSSGEYFVQEGSKHQFTQSEVGQGIVTQGTQGETPEGPSSSKKFWRGKSKTSKISKHTQRYD